MTIAENITVSWKNRFTTKPSFCVDARSVGSFETIASVCVNDTQYTFTSLDTDLCEELSFTVTPTDGERNGTSSEPVTDYFKNRKGACVNIMPIISKLPYSFPYVRRYQLCSMPAVKNC